ncbi:hypothetical protein [Flexivirga oryzae]|uniref:Chromate transport protein ChrA n=1 Tax=Flexivirga oryzae TaxID=1794944 RepID=A0A839N7Y6_9MICO|nr:hypothetical protein [Flexivirga oryzae]MBB2890772.1 chromate transport protein ChrA [Flexivirga oryzae]
MTVTDSTWRLPGVLLALQTLVLVVLAAALVVAGTTGGTDDTGRSVTEGATVLALAVCSGLLALGFWRHRSVARTPSLLWNALAVIVGITVATSGAPWIGVLVVVVGVASFVASLRVPRYELDDDE